MFIVALLLSACSELNFNTEAADPDPHAVCAWSAVEIGLDEDPGIGFSAAEVLAVTDGPRRTTLRWDWTGETTELVSELSDDGAPRWNTAELVHSETGEPWTSDDATPDELCPPHILLPVSWTAQTVDGRLDERFRAEIALHNALVAPVVVVVDFFELDGSGPPLEIEPDDWDTVELEFVANVSTTEGGAVGTAGEIAVYANRSGEDEESAWDEGYLNDVGRWPVED